jgi:hypothetical protein
MGAPEQPPWEFPSRDCALRACAAAHGIPFKALCNSMKGVVAVVYTRCLREGCLWRGTSASEQNAMQATLFRRCRCAWKATHPLFSALAQDLVIPHFKPPWSLDSSPLLSAAPRRRNITLFLRGDVGKGRLPHYSRGIRQMLYNMTVTRRLNETHGFRIGGWGVQGVCGGPSRQSTLQVAKKHCCTAFCVFILFSLVVNADCLFSFNIVFLMYWKTIWPFAFGCFFSLFYVFFHFLQAVMCWKSPGRHMGRCRRANQRMPFTWTCVCLSGDDSDVPGSYSELLASSKFCPVAPGACIC